MKEERDRIRLMLYRNTLTNAWLVNRLEEKGVNTEKTEMSSVLRGIRKGPKAKTIIRTSLDILEKYEKKNEYRLTPFRHIGAANQVVRG